MYLSRVSLIISTKLESSDYVSIQSVIDHINSKLESSDYVSSISVFDPQPFQILKKNFQVMVIER